MFEDGYSEDDVTDPVEDASAAPDTPVSSGEDKVTVTAILPDGDAVDFTVDRGSTLLDLSRSLHLPNAEKQVATDDNDTVLVPTHEFTSDHTHICYVVNAKGGARG